MVNILPVIILKNSVVKIFFDGGYVIANKIIP